jgi:hypothetical protein
MCDFEDMDIISRYSRQQAVDDGILVEVLRFNGKSVMATTHLVEKIGLDEVRAIWKEFRYWEMAVKPALRKEEQTFSTGANGKQVWVIEDGEAFTLMYPEDY